MEPNQTDIKSGLDNIFSNQTLIQAFVHTTINIALHMQVLHCALWYFPLNFTGLHWWWTGRLTSPQADLPVEHEEEEVRGGERGD